MGVLECGSFFRQNGVRTLFHIDCIGGKDIRNPSFLQHEDEIRLLPARELLVKSSLTSGNGLHIIQLKETEPQYPLLETVFLPNSTAQSEMGRQGSTTIQRSISFHLFLALQPGGHGHKKESLWPEDAGQVVQLINFTGLEVSVSIWGTLSLSPTGGITGSWNSSIMSRVEPCSSVMSKKGVKLISYIIRPM